MTIEEIKVFQSWFVKATHRAVEAGFDIVEIHSAHGYGINQWLSPITNQRTDAYGGSLMNRMRILEEIVTMVKMRHPKILVSLRFPGQDLLPEGMTRTEAQFIAKRLVRAGVDLFNVSSGMGGWRRPRDRRGQGYLVDEAEAIATVVDVPVIGVGGIKENQFIEMGLRRGRFDLAAVGRAILNDPRGFRRSFEMS